MEYYVRKVLWSLDGRWLYSAGLSGHLAVWDPVTFQEVLATDIGAPCWDICRQGKTLTLALEDGTVRLYEVDTEGKVYFTKTMPIGKKHGELYTIEMKIIVG